MPRPFSLIRSLSLLGMASALLSPARGASVDSPDGAHVFADKPCSVCHSIGGKGGAAGPKLDDIGARHDAVWIRKKIVNPTFDNPKTGMPAVQTTPQELDTLVAYLSSQKATPAPGAGVTEKPTPKKATYVGSAVCITCHSDLSKQFRKTVHSDALMLSHESKTQSGCESCHGPGSEHAASGDPTLIVQPAKLKPRQNGDLCLRCHNAQISRRDWMTSSHSQQRVSCNACHLVMKQAASKLLRKPADELCASCHRKEAAQFLGVSHHPVPEGRMHCVDCHDPHSGANEGMLRKPANEQCLDCHADKQGPFVFDHPAVNGGFTEGCLSCHAPHGSPFKDLRKIGGRGLCLQCHSDKAVNHFDTYPDCVSAGCHTQIHGSDEDQLFQK